jgi:hypothetical protein
MNVNIKKRRQDIRHNDIQQNDSLALSVEQVKNSATSSWSLQAGKQSDQNYFLRTNEFGHTLQDKWGVWLTEAGCWTFKSDFNKTTRWAQN